MSPRSLQFPIVSACISLMLIAFYVQWNTVKSPATDGQTRPTAANQRLPNRTFCIDGVREGESNIFIVETGVDYLTPKALIAVESAAFHNPDWWITVVFINQSNSLGLHINESEESMSTLALDALKNHYGTIRQVYSDLESVTKDTVLYDLVKSKAFTRRVSKKGSSKKLRIVQSSDLCRLAILLKCGGIYIDDDTITLRSLNSEYDYIMLNSAYQEQYAYGGLMNSFLKFTRGHQFLEMAARESVSNYDPRSYIGLMRQLRLGTRFLCPNWSEQAIAMNRTASDQEFIQCRDNFAISRPGFGISNINGLRLLEEASGEANERRIRKEHSRIVHVSYSYNKRFNRNSFGIDLKTSNCALARLFRTHCPFLFNSSQSIYI